METLSLNSQGKLTKSDLDQVASLLKKGGTIVVPTDTSYGLAAIVTKKKGVESVFRLKQRDKSKTVSMVVASQSQALEYGVVSCKPKALWKAFLPGPMTLVVWAKKTIPMVTRSDKTIAIRKIDTPVVNQILRSIGQPITITSANKSGKPDIYSLNEFLSQYKITKPDYFIDAGKLKKTKPSTIVSAKKGEPVEVLRLGPISKKRIEDALLKH